jgi:hypothetical protein
MSIGQDIVAQLATLIAEQVIQTLFPNQSQANLAQEHSPYHIELNTDRVLGDVYDATIGLTAAKGQRDSILSAIAGLSPVTLPTPPPSGFQEPITAGVWSELVGLQEICQSIEVDPPDAAYSLGQAAFAGMLLAGSVGLPWPGNPDFVLKGCSPQELILWTRNPPEGMPFIQPGLVDWTAWDGVETITGLLNRVVPTLTWQQDFAGAGLSGTAHALIPGWPLAIRWCCLVKQCDLPLRSGRLWTGQTVAGGAPVWPGSDNVTFGEAVAVADGATALGPMHGVLIELDAPGAGIDAYTFGAYKSYLHLGGVAFEGGSGIFEVAQPFSFRNHLLCPKSIRTPVAAIMRLGKPLAGTMTPWMVK